MRSRAVSVAQSCYMHPTRTEKTEKQIHHERMKPTVINRTAIDDPSPSERAFENLVASLYTAGLSVEARDGDLGSILLFAKAADEEMLLSAVYQSRYPILP